MFLRAFLRLALALIFFALPVSAHASDAPDLIGTVIEIEGTASKTSLDLEDRPQPLRLEEPVYLHDKITTGPNSRLLILFIDDTQITLGENAFLTVDEYVFDPAANVESYAKFRPLKGAFLWVSGWIAKAQRHEIEIETPTASLGIRGTTVWGGWLDEDYGVLVQEGAVSVKNDTGSVLVRAGEGVNLRGREIRPSEIKPWQQPKIDRAVGMIALKDMPRIQSALAAQKERNLQRRRDHADLLAARREKRRQLIEGQREENREKLEQKIEERQEKLPDRELPRKIIEEEKPAQDFDLPAPAESADQKRARREQRSREWIKNRQ